MIREIKLVITYIILFVITISSIAQKRENIMNEKYDFETVKKYPITINPIGIKRNGWTILMYRSTDNRGGFYREYPPQPEYYWIAKAFHPNGNIKEVAKIVGQTCRIGESIYYDEMGNITKIVDEDANFGKFKVEEILKFIENEGHINLETGVGLERAFIHENDQGEVRSAGFDIYGAQVNGKECYAIQIGWRGGGNTETIYHLDKDTGEVLFKESKTIYPTM